MRFRVALVYMSSIQHSAKTVYRKGHKERKEIGKIIFAGSMISALIIAQQRHFATFAVQFLWLNADC